MRKKIKLVIIFLLATLVFFGCLEERPDNHISQLPPMKDQFADYFMMGNIFNPGELSGNKGVWLTRHYNVLTAENHMKPGYLAPSKGSYNFSTANTMVNTANAAGFKVVGHTLLWHSQNADWMNNVTSTTALNDMKDYITAVVKNFEGKIYSWDVLNEVFPDPNMNTPTDWKQAMRSNNPWFRTIGYNFVYEGFLATRFADPAAILYYNDYNTDNSRKAQLIHDMVRDVNLQYAALPASQKPAGEDPNRLLIEGIGIQEHHNTGIQPSAVRATLELFKPLGVIISVSELDVLSQTWGEYSGNAGITDNGRKRHAELYGEFMELYLEYSDIIERVTLWGVTDNQSWRARGEPLLFLSNGAAKPAYYSFVGALEKHKAK